MGMHKRKGMQVDVIRHMCGASSYSWVRTLVVRTLSPPPAARRIFPSTLMLSVVVRFAPTLLLLTSLDRRTGSRLTVRWWVGGVCKP